MFSSSCKKILKLPLDSINLVATFAVACNVCEGAADIGPGGRL
jgi:hypothetical protein